MFCSFFLELTPCQLHRAFPSLTPLETSTTCHDQAVRPLPGGKPGLCTSFMFPPEPAPRTLDTPPGCLGRGPRSSAGCGRRGEWQSHSRGECTLESPRGRASAEHTSAGGSPGAPGPASRGDRPCHRTGAGSSPAHHVLRPPSRASSALLPGWGCWHLAPDVSPGGRHHVPSFRSEVCH